MNLSISDIERLALFVMLGAIGLAAFAACFYQVSRLLVRIFGTTQVGSVSNENPKLTVQELFRPLEVQIREYAESHTKMVEKASAEQMGAIKDVRKELSDGQTSMRNALEDLRKEVGDMKVENAKTDTKVESLQATVGAVVGQVSVLQSAIITGHRRAEDQTR